MIILITFFQVKLSFADNDYSIENYKVSMDISSEGNMHVVETLTYKFYKDTKGITRSIYVKNLGKVVNMKVYEIYPEKKELEIDIFNESEMVDFRVYDKSKEETKIFKIEYDLNNVITSYMDTNEFFWKFIDESNVVTYKNLNIYINFYQINKINDLKVFQHGYLYNNFKIKNKSIVYNIKKIPQNTKLELRILIPKDEIKNNNKFINKNVYNQIIKEETELKIKNDKQIYNINLFNKVGICILIIQFLIEAIVYFRLFHVKNTLRKKYCNKPPKNHPPAIMSSIVNYKKLYIKDMVATLINLIRKKHISVKEIKNDSSKDYIFELMHDNLNHLDNHEKYLIDWLFYSIGCNKSISLKQIQTFNKNKKNIIKFKMYCNNWKEKVLKECEEQGYFERKNKLYKIFIRYLCTLEVLVGIVGMYMYQNYTMQYIYYLISGFFLIMYTKIFKRNKIAYKEYKRWMDFKRFLIKFKDIKHLNEETSSIWEMYIIYSISFGFYEKVITKFKYILNKKENNINRNELLYILDDNLITSLEKAFNIKKTNKIFILKK